ncbi:DUF1622 domain-containing protein [Sphingomonas sp. MJ1 (PH-R8)]|uniref:DUF1622 domain-containing protein n=1 Tax=Sphingomonas sp. MJ1 (PH-R8) TaxID=3112950 RepID=UPI003A836A05
MIDESLLLSAIHGVTRAVEVIGVTVLLLGAAVSGVRYVRDLRRCPAGAAYKRLRSNLGRSILLGLELLVAADIINTVAIEPTLESLAVLAGIVLIRTFLSFSLEVEIDGRWPWQARNESDGGREQPSG